MLGLPKEFVKLEPYSETWQQSFAQEAARIRGAIGRIESVIEHIGSTSISGIAAKPIIDIAVGLKNLADGEKCVAPLEKIGYEYRGEYGIAGRFYFVKGEPRTHHLHMIEIGSDLWRSHLSFREYLRANPPAAREYENLKLEAARKYFNNREAYQNSKTEFIEKILQIAGF